MAEKKPSYREMARQMKQLMDNYNQLKAELRYFVAKLYLATPKDPVFKQIDEKTMEQIKVIAKSIEGTEDHYVDEKSKVQAD